MSDAKYFSSVFISFFLHLKLDFRHSSLSFVRLSWGRITNKLVKFRSSLNQLKLLLKWSR